MERIQRRIIGKLVWQDPDRVSGQPCFYGTRVPIQNLFDYLEGPYTAEQFAQRFRLPLDQVQGVLKLGLLGIEQQLDAA